MGIDNKPSFSDRWSKNFSRESIFKQAEIKHVIDVLYKHFKCQKKTLKTVKSVLIICANNNVESLYSLDELFKENKILKR